MVVAARALSIRAYGFDKRGRETLRLAFEYLGQNIARLSESEDADSAIFNLDSLQDATLLHEYRQRRPHTPVITLGMKDPGLQNTSFIEKPVSVTDVMAAVRDIQKRIGPVVEAVRPASDVVQVCSAQSTPQAKTPSRPSPRINASEYFNPQEFVQSLLIATLEKSRASCNVIRLVFNNYRDSKPYIFFVPGIERVATNMDVAQLKKICSTPLSMANYSSKVIEDAAAMRVMNKMSEDASRYVSFDDFLWRTGLWVSDGQLPKDTDLVTPITLRHWPNMTRLGKLPHAARIAALLIKTPMSLPAVAKVLNLPMSDVVTFYNAAASIGLIEQGGSAVSPGGPAPTHQDRPILKRLLGYLRQT